MDFKGKIPKILMGRRHSGHSFMPDKFVFPGGRVDRSDRIMNVASPLEKWVEDRLLTNVTRPSALKARAIALAAIRETYEETGIMVGEKGLGVPPVLSGTSWEQFSAKEIWPSLDQLHFVARAITPPSHSKRFDTRFFLADARNIGHVEPGMVREDAELTETLWIPLNQAKTLNIPSITGMIIDEVSDRIKAGFKPFIPIPLFREIRGRFIRQTL